MLRERKSRLLSFTHMCLAPPPQTVQPKQSSWFASYPIATDGETRQSNETNVLPLRQSDIYLEDWIGLKSLDKRGALVMDLCHGVHMQIDAACQMKVFGKYVGIAPPSPLVPRFLRHGWARAVYSVTGLRTQAMPATLQLLLVISSLVVLHAVARGAKSVFRARQGAIRL